MTEDYNKTIFKKDTKGKIRFLNVIADHGELIQISGVVGTDKPVDHRSMCSPKNVGRANETTATEQAVLEAKSKIETKMSQGYFESQEEAENELVVLPMLAKDYKKEKKKIVFPAHVQPKLDGMRCLIIVQNGKARLMSRTGKEITTMDHIRKDVADLYVNNIVLDGELYAHGKTFQENMKLIKKYRPGESEQVHFRMYDIITDDPFKQRDAQIDEYLALSDAIYISGVETELVHTEGEIRKYHQRFISEGYEGTMVRWGDEGYKTGGRSSNLLKYKDFIDVACEIVDIKPSEKNPEQGIVVAKNDAGEFGCGMKFSHAERADMLENKDKYIGKMAEIRFFEYTDDGLPRFPVCVGIRLDK